MNGAELLVRCLEREGVRYVFGVPGEETLDVNDALARSSVRFVPVRHEQAAAFMADVWGRLTGQAGVCLATLGPGATNLATGLADAIRLANDSSFGLGASLWTQDRARAERLAAQIVAGAVFVNGLVKSDARLPFGGIKRSGYGRELSEYGIREFVNIKSVWIA